MSAAAPEGPAESPAQALQDVTVVALSAMGPIPFATMLLADLGARVIRVDRIGGAGSVTGLPPEDDPRTRGHRGIGVDARNPAGRDLVARLVGGSDVFLEGMRPGSVERLGLGPADLLAANPRLVYGRATGWGQSGPRAARAGHDINYAGLAGALQPMGHADRPPLPPLNLLADFGGGGAYLVIGVLAALHQRTLSGRGQLVDAAMVDGVASLTGMLHGMVAAGLWSEQRGENLLDGGAPFYRTYATADGRYLAVGALEPQFYAVLLTTLGLDPADWPQHDRARWPELERVLTETFVGRTRAQWQQVFDPLDACVSPVLSPAEAALAPELRERNTFVDWDGMAQPAPAPRLSDSAVVPRPRSGRCSHTREILAELGLSEPEISALERDRVIA